METETEIFKKFRNIATQHPAPVQREAAAVMHKMRYPMRNILAKVPGDSLTERAKRLKVSRQTMYVWLSEKFRPTRTQAKRVAKVTGIPIEHIVDDGFEAIHDARGKARKKAARLAAGPEKAAQRPDGTSPKRRRSVDVEGGASAA